MHLVTGVNWNVTELLLPSLAILALYSDLELQLAGQCSCLRGAPDDRQRAGRGQAQQVLSLGVCGLAVTV